MTKTESYERIDKGDLTWGHLKHYIGMCLVDADLDAKSAVNRELTRGQSLNILHAACDPKEDNELIVSPQYTQPRNARNSLIAVNVLRETHFRVPGPTATEEPR